MSTEETISNNLPVGAIISFAGMKNQIPKNWKECNGACLNKNEQPELFNAIGTIWGGSGTPDFYLPDLRGMFLRGVAGESNIDPEKELRQSPQMTNSPTNPGMRGNEVGSIQGCEIQAHQHKIMLGVTHDFAGPQVRGGIYDRATSSGYSNDAGGKETRPVNAYVYYIIKVLNIG